MSNSSPNDVLDPRLLPPGFGLGTNGAASANPYAQTHPRGTTSSFKQDNPYFGTQARSNSDDAMDSVEARGRQDDGYDEDGEQHSPGGDDAKRPRACEACRGLKVRCDQDPSFPDRPCKRCAKANRQCVITQASRKRQKKADSRVADLEKKLDALTAVLHAQQSGGALRGDHFDQKALAAGDSRTMQESAQPRQYSGPAPITSYGAQTAPSMMRDPGINQDAPPNKKRRMDEEASLQTTPARQNIQAPTEQLCDLPPYGTLDKAVEEVSAALRKGGNGPHQFNSDPNRIRTRICEIVDPALHSKLFSRYVHELAPNLPAVVFPPGTDAHDVLKTKPVLFLCILAASSTGLASQQTQSELAAEVVHVIADTVVRAASKSLELIQAMLVAVMWYKPPEGRDQANFYQIIHMAACMGLDLGLGRRFDPKKSKRGFSNLTGDMAPGKLPPQSCLVDSDTIEARRTWLSCYYLCASISMVFRRPNLIKWTNYMGECINVLETSSDAHESDRLLVQHIRIQKICDDISESFFMDDASATTVSIADPKVSYTIDVYEQKLKDWENKLGADQSNRPQLMFFHDVSVLYLHEIAMHVNHNVDDFRMPFTEDSLRSGLQYNETLTIKQMAALEACLHAAHRIISNYCSFGFETLSGLPTLLFFVRCIYALVVLIKMHVAVTTPGSEVGKIIKPEDIKVGEHVEQLWNLFTSMARSDMSRPHWKVLKILGILREWFYKHQEGDGEAPAPTKSAPHGRYPHGKTEDSKLQVLSEAATAGSGQQRYSQNPQAPLSMSVGWSYDAQSVVPYSGENFSQSNSSGPSPDTFSTRTSTPYHTASTNMSSYPSASSAYQQPEFPGQEEYKIFTPGGTDDLNWTAGLDLEQLLDGAFRDIDMSGDLGGWFLGEGVGAYQLPADGAAPTGPGASDNTGSGAKW